MSAAHSDLLALIAEVSATFVGFSLVVGLLRPGDPTAAARRSSMQAVAELGLIAAGGALLVLLLDSAGFRAETSWRASSATVAAGWLVMLYVGLRRARRSAGTLLETQPLVGGTLAVVGVSLLVWNALAPGPPSGPRYMSALTVALADSAFLFLQATFRQEPPPMTESAADTAVERND